LSDPFGPAAFGRAYYAVAQAPPASGARAFSAAGATASAEPRDGGFVLRGQKPHVLAADGAALVVAPFREPSGQVSLFAVEIPSGAVTVEPEVPVDPTRRAARVSFDGVAVGADARLEGAGEAVLARVHVRALAALAAEMVGAADAALEMTRQYAIDRKQFGRQIGFFQAVKHPLADVLVGVELARNLVLGAAAALDTDPGVAEVPARMAKAMASDVLANAVRKGVQLHGGYGFTLDCDMHLYFKRALWSRAMLGDAVHHRRALAAALIDGEGQRTVPG